MHLEVLTEKGKEIFAQLNAFRDFYLAGGTALALQIAHRRSVDFDLFTAEEIPVGLLAKVKRVFENSSVIVSVNDPGELTVFADDVKITFLHYPYPVVQDRVEEDGLSLLSIQEIAATKAYTIGRRGFYKDYVDLYFVLKGQYASLEEILAIAEKKYGADFNGRLFLEQLVYLDDIHDTEILFLQEPITKDQLAEFFIQEIRKNNF
jgi:hypothetical protein